MHMSTPLNQHIINETLFKPASFEAPELQHLFFKELNPKIDFADIYLQNSINESWILEDSQVKRVSNVNYDCRS